MKLYNVTHNSLALGFALLAVVVHGCAKEGTPQTEKTTVQADDVIPFLLTESNNIVIDVTLDDEHRIPMMLHTAVTSVSITTDTIESLGLKWEEAGAVNSWGGKKTVRQSSGHSIRIGNQTWGSLLLTESPLSGPGTGGKVGYNLYQDRVLKIDFETKELRVLASLPNVDGFEKFEIEREDGLLFIHGSLKLGSETITHRFLIHSGFGGVILLDDVFVEKNNLAERLRTVGESHLKDSLGHVLTTKQVVVPAFSLGTFTCPDVPVSIFSGGIRNQKLSVLGGDALKRFHLILDLQHFHLYLKPNKMFEVKYSS